VTAHVFAWGASGRGGELRRSAQDIRRQDAKAREEANLAAVSVNMS